MPASLAELQSRLDALRRLRATGVRTLDHNGARIENRSMDELTRAIGFLETEIAYAGGAVQTRTFKLTSSKDL